MRNVFSAAMSAKDATLLAIQALAAAKAYDANCGGDTQFMMMKYGGAISRVVPYDIHSSERFIADYEQTSRQLLFDIGSDDLPDAEFESRLAHFIDSSRYLRQSFAEVKNTRKLYDELWFTPEDSLDPESTKGDQSTQPPSPELPGGSDES
jgi:hypothetical protein